MKKKMILKALVWAYLVIVLLITLLFSVHPVQAQGTGITIFSLKQQDINGDGRPDLTVIECAFATERDVITVVDQGNDMHASSNWQKATDFSNDIWLYDIGGDGSIQLVVRYQVEDKRETAYVYDDRDNDGQVSVERNGLQVSVLESKYGTARIISDSNWFLPDGRINLNVTIQLDGPIPTLDRAPAEYINDWLPHDGLIDVEFEQVAGSDGIAEYAVKRLLTDSPGDWSFERTGLYSNEGHYPTNPHERTFFPFLPIAPDFRHNPRLVYLRYFDFPPHVHIDWIGGKVLAVELAGYPIGHGYHFNNSRYIVKNQINDVGFESPQAYYDLANNHDAFAEMHIRFFTRPANDRTMWSLPNFEAIPWQSISYDWNLFNLESLRWDFKIGLGGNYTIDSVTRFRDFAVRTVPFKQLPYWITEREWKMTTFVAREGEGYQSSEGIYEWQTDTGDDPEVNPERAFKARDATFGYTLGTIDQPPDEYFQTTHPGFRAERHFADPIKPNLYFSPLDRKLHLQGAEAGVWTIDDKRLIRYSNLDGDDYLDHWSYIENRRLKREFYWAADYLIYVGENEIWLKRVKVQPSLFETLPPRNHEEWLAQRQILETNQPDFAPEDFKAMLTQFPGSAWQLTGAIMRDFRLEDKGFRFILELEPSFHVVGLGGPDLNNFSSGAYVVTYQNTFRIEQLTPAKPLAALLPVTLTHLELNSLPVKVWNDGLVDLPKATLELWVTSPDGITSVVADQDIELLAQKSDTVNLMWAPSSSGTWVLTPKIRRPDGRLTSGDSVSIVVASAQNESPLHSVLVSTSTRRIPVILLGLITLATMTAVVFWRAWGQPLTKKSDDEPQDLNPKQNEAKGGCPNCQAHERQNKAGFNRSGSQRHRCGHCKRVYTPNPKSHGYPVEIWMLAVRMYAAGTSYGNIGRALKVSKGTVINWVKRYRAKASGVHAPQRQSVAEVDHSYSPMDYEMNLPGGEVHQDTYKD